MKRSFLLVLFIICFGSLVVGCACGQKQPVAETPPPQPQVIKPAPTPPPPPPPPPKPARN